MDIGILSYTAFIAIAAFQLIYIGVQYFFNRRMEYVYYIGYITSLIAYSTLSHEPYIHFHFFTTIDPNAPLHFDRALGLTAYFFYYRFGRHFLELSSLYPRLDRYIRKAEYLVLSYVIFELIWEFCGLSRTIGEYIFTAVGFLMTIITGYFIALLLPQKIPLTGFIIAGVIIIHIGALITMAIIQGVYKTDYFITYVPVHSAAVIELIIFTSGLAYKSKMNEQIKVKSQRALIEQLEKNLKLEQQIQHTQNLLARQMHDELGSTISSIKIYTELANKNLTDANRNVSSYIQKAHTLSVQLMDYMSDMLWTINPNNQGNEKLLQRIREYEREYLLHLDIKIDSLEIDLVSTELTTGLRCDLLVLSRSYFKMIEPETRQSIDYRLIATPTFIQLTLSNVIKQDKNSKFNELIAKHNGSITYENDALIINLPITIISDTPV